MTRYRLLAAVLLMACPLAAADTVFELDPSQTTVQLTLHDVLHTVHASFKLKSGNLHLDPATGRATGEIVVDAASGDSGSQARDKRMHKEILESQKYPEAVFTPDRVEGKVATQGQSEVDIHGTFKIHGASHELTLHFKLDAQSAERCAANTTFTIPYVKWGMKNPSNFLLKVDDHVEMAVQTVAVVHSR